MEQPGSAASPTPASESPASSPSVVHFRDAPIDPHTHFLRDDMIYIGSRPARLTGGIKNWVHPQARWMVPEEVQRGSGGEQRLLRRYRDYLRENHTLRDRLFKELAAGKSLVCWCRNKDFCHGTVIIDLFAKQQEEKRGRARFMALYAKAAAKAGGAPTAV